MYTVETALDILQKYDISQEELARWESSLGLEIPLNEFGNKSYSPHHVNLFKNVKKHMALGRTIDEIKQIIALPPIIDSTPSTTPTAISKPSKPYASAPQRPVSAQRANTGGGAEGVVELVRKLTSEKDHLYQKLVETEKLNSHLYNANNMFHGKVKELTDAIGDLKGQIGENEKFKLLDEKSQLQRQLIDLEKTITEKNNEIARVQQTVDQYQAKHQELEARIHSLTQGFDASHFTGDWMESGKLTEIVYDNFGINIESERVRLFRISQTPERVYGSTAIISTVYQYDSNTLWKRNETLTVCWIDDNTLSGEVIAEYILDGVPVAKAIYQVQCTRN